MICLCKVCVDRYSPLWSIWCRGEGWCPGDGRGSEGEAGQAVNGDVGGGCGEAAGASGEGARGEAGEADTPGPAPAPLAAPLAPGGDVRLNEPPPIY